MRGGTELGRVRGLGSAKEGAGHWWQQRLTAFANIVLILWLLASLLRLPSLDYGIMVSWVRQPVTAVALMLIVFNTFWHVRLGLQVVIEDYQHGASRIAFLGLRDVLVFGGGALALFAILKIALTGAVS